MTATKQDTKINPGQVRLMRVVEALAGYEIEGRRLSDIAATTGSSLPLALRDLRSLAAAGWAEQRDDGGWRLGPKPVQIALAFTAQLQKAREQLDEFQQRYTRTTT